MFSRLRFFTAFSTKKLEWSVAVQTVGFGAFLLAPGASMVGSAGLVAATDLMPEENWGILFLGIGGAAAWALHVDGVAWWTPFARMVTMAAIIVALCFLAKGFLPWSPGAYYFLSTAFLFGGNGFLAASRDVGQEIKWWRYGRGDGE